MQAAEAWPWRPCLLFFAIELSFRAWLRQLRIAAAELHVASVVERGPRPVRVASCRTRAWWPCSWSLWLQRRGAARVV